MANEKKKSSYISGKESRNISRFNRRVTKKLEAQRADANKDPALYTTKMRDENNVVEFDNVCTYFFSDVGTVKAVDGVSFDIPKCSTVGVVGESGCGKSVTSLSLMQLLQRPSGQTVGGEIRFNQDDGTALNIVNTPTAKMQEIRGKEISLIPQNPTESLNPIRRIGKQLTECMTVHGNKDKELADSRRDEFLRRFGFSDPDRINRAYSFQLSGGMNQRVISAMGLMNRPKWVIADEPTKGLDAILRRQVYRVLKEISETDTEGMIVITHDIALAGALCDRLMVLYKGSIMEAGETKTILEHPAHPYTKGLIASLPGKGMNPIGRAVRKKEGNSGCSFYPRCAHAVDACKNGRIPEAELPDGRKVRCVRYA